MRWLADADAHAQIALATMVNGFFALEMLPMTKYVNNQVSRGRPLVGV